MPKHRIGLRLAVWSVVFGTLVVPNGAGAMQIEPLSFTNGDVLIGARGPIVRGDAERLRRVIAALPPGKHLIGLALDSPGGSVEEGSRMAADIHDHYLSVVVPAQSKCASACFLLFAAAARRVVAADALIGVHSASEEGEETPMAMAVTTAMARTASVYGVPPIILGKMVSTVPGRIEWLTASDLALMSVKVYAESDTEFGLSAVPPRPLAAQQAAPPSISPSVQKAAAEEGRSARRGWETWLAQMRGPSHDGAAFAVSQRLAATPLPCEVMRSKAAGFVTGCTAAVQRLSTITERLARDIDFRLGWMNAMAPPAAEATSASVPVRAGQVTPGILAEFQGALFCTDGAASLHLQITASSEANRQHAVLSFGPTATNAAVPSGSFITEGTIVLDGGPVELDPVSWIAQAPGWDMLGLVGSSEDNGRTFTGRTVATKQCSSFTMRRKY